MKNLKKYITTALYIISILFFVFSILLATNNNFSNSLKYYNTDSIPLFHINSKNIVNYKITSTVNDLSSIYLKFGTYEKTILDKTLTFTIKDTSGRTIRNIEKDSQYLMNNQYTVFDFEKIENSIGKEYNLEIKCEKCEETELAIYGNYVNESYELTLAQLGKSFNTNYITITFLISIISIIVAICIKNNKLENKILKYFESKHLLFVVHFITSLLMVISLLAIVLKIKNSIYFPIFSYLMFTIFLFVDLNIIIYWFKKKDKKIENYFLILMIPIGLYYLFLMIPTHVPDEETHYASAYDMATEGLIADDSYTEIPEIIKTNHVYTLNSYEKFAQIISEKSNYQETEQARVSGYTFVTYAPSIIGIFIGRILNINPYIAFYLARLLTFITFLILGFYTIKLLPIGKYLLCIYYFNPMMIQQQISISADAMINSLCLFFIAYTLNIARKTKLEKRNITMLVILLLLISTLKYVYIPLILLVVLLFIRKENSLDKKKKKVLIVAITGSIISCVGLYIYAMITSNYISPYVIENNVDTIGQLKYFLNNITILPKIIIDTINSKLTFYVESFAGNLLGWLNITINRVITYTYIFILIFSCFIYKEKEEYTKTEKILMFSVFFINFILIIFGMYLSWTSIGATIVEGVQGRYFLPIALLLLLCIPSKKKYLEFKNRDIIITILLLIIHIITLLTIVSSFS